VNRARNCPWHSRLASFEQVEADYLISQLDAIEDRDTANLIDALGHDATGSIAKLRQAASECSAPELRAAKHAWQSPRWE
jgi:hypothetical protein